MNVKGSADFVICVESKVYLKLFQVVAVAVAVVAAAVGVVI